MISSLFESPGDIDSQSIKTITKAKSKSYDAKKKEEVAKRKRTQRRPVVFKTGQGATHSPLMSPQCGYMGGSDLVVACSLNIRATIF